MNFLAEWAVDTWDMTLEAAPWLVFGFLFAGVVYLLLPADKVVRHLGTPGWAGVFKASAIGVPLPLCSCSVIPVALSMRQRGASRGATAGFLVSTPETGLDSIAISYALLGPFLAVVRPIAAFITAMVAGGLIASVERRCPAPAAAPLPAQPPAGGCCCHGAAEAPVRLASRARKALEYGFVEMFASISHWLVLGFGLAGLASALIPDGFLETAVGQGVGGLLIMLLAGLPLYVCATSATPLAAALIAKGLSPGAAVVFLLVGPATNAATMVVVGRELGRLSLVLYVLSIAVVALLLGLAVDALPWAAMTTQAVAREHAHAHAGITSHVFAFMLVGLLLNGLRVRLLRNRRARSKPAEPCHQPVVH